MHTHHTLRDRGLAGVADARAALVARLRESVCLSKPFRRAFAGHPGAAAAGGLPPAGARRTRARAKASGAPAAKRRRAGPAEPAGAAAPVRALGTEDHASVASTYNNLAILLKEQGRLRRAMDHIPALVGDQMTSKP